MAEVVNMVRLEGKNFPFRLLRLRKQPNYLYIRGNPEFLHKPSLAIIGSRHCSDWGLDQAFKIGRMVSKENITVVSGLARGIDTSAHQGALEGAGGTIAVLGSGLDAIYPAENLSLAQSIESHGLLVSEYEPTETPQRHYFLQRNRLIAALSDIVLVIESALHSGTSHAARFAARCGIPTFALNHHSAGSGNKHLIEKGIARPLADTSQLVEIIHQLQSKPQQMTFSFSSKGAYCG